MTEQSNPQPPPPVKTPPGWYNDPNSGRVRWWDGDSWTEHFAQNTTAQPPTNGFAVTALVLGIVGFVLTPIPLGIGLFLGGIPALLAAIFGIIGMVKADNHGGSGKGMAVTGFILGLLAVLAIFLGAGTIW